MNIKNNPKYFYSYCKKLSRTKTQIGPLRTEMGAITEDPQLTCKLLTKQYNSAYSKPRLSAMISDPISFFTGTTSHTTSQADKLSDFKITEENIV